MAKRVLAGVAPKVVVKIHGNLAYPPAFTQLLVLRPFMIPQGQLGVVLAVANVTT
jgi:hypothetical protein